jgi:hypothetical protein
MAGRVFQVALEVLGEISAQLPVEQAETLSLSDAGSVALYAPLSTSGSDTISLSDGASTNLGIDPKARVFQVALEVIHEIGTTVGLDLAGDDALSLSDAFSIQIRGDYREQQADTLALSDAGAVALGLQTNGADTLSLSDASNAAIADQVRVDFSDSLALADALQVNFLIYAYPISLEFFESLSLGDSAWDLPFTTGAPNFKLQHAESLHFQEALEGPIEHLYASALESLALTETGELILRAAIEGYDSLFYNWAEEFRMELAQVISGSDTISLSDSATYLVVVTGLNATGSDTLAAFWADGHLLRTEANPQFAESLALYDAFEVKIFGGLALSDSLELTDDFALRLASSNPGQSATGFVEGLSFSEAYTISLSVPIQVQAGDSLTLSDNSNAKRSGTDLSYLRRYLNDVRSE